MNIKKLTTPRFGVKYTNKKDVVVRKQQKGNI